MQSHGNSGELYAGEQSDTVVSHQRPVHLHHAGT